MPGLSGFEMLESLPASSPPVAILSSSNADDDRQRAQANSRVVAYLTKPPSAESLRALIDRM